MDLIFAFVVVLPFMFMYLVLFAALALKMRSSIFQGASSEMRVEGRQILGQVFYFLYYVGSLLRAYLPLEMSHTQNLGAGGPLGVPGNR